MSATRDLPLLEPANRSELRAWLDANHATSSGVHLAIGKKGNPVSSLTYEEAIEEALNYGWIDSTAHRLDEHRFTILFAPRRPGSTWSKSNKERVERLIEQGRMTPAGLAPIEAAKADGSWESLNEVDDLVVPDDLAAALEVVPGAAEGFEALSASPRKLALYWISTAKRPETRAKRIAETVRAAAEGRGPVG